MKGYYSLRDTASSELIVRKSRFITSVTPVGDAESAGYYINLIKKKYYDAAHNCYAYIISSDEARFSDDGEPQGTAGLPMLSVLKKKGLERTLAVVTRYFGGVKLGAAGLVSAYSSALTGCLDAADIKRYIYSSVITVKCGYPLLKVAESAFKLYGASVIEAEYGEVAAYTVSIEDGARDTLKNALAERTSGQIEIEERYKAYL